MVEGIDLGIQQLIDATVIGRGGFSTVYAATDTQFDRRVAVKVLHPLAKESDRLRFERECRIMGRLSSHPAVVTVYQAGYTDNDEPYLVMELNEDGSLGDRLKAMGALRWQQAVEYMVPIVEALQKAHEADILHRDVKPENILLADGVPRLTDFGIAYLRDSTGSASTSISASWLHTAPETFDNERDERSDIYSAASTLYDLIAGQPPFFNGSDESLNPLMRRLLNDPPPPLPAGTAPATLDTFLRRSLAKDPDERPQTAQEFADGLRTILESDGTVMPAAHEASGSATVTTGPPTLNPDSPNLKPDPTPGRPKTERPPPPANVGTHLAVPSQVNPPVKVPPFGRSPVSAHVPNQTPGLPPNGAVSRQPTVVAGAGSGSATPGRRSPGVLLAVGTVGVLMVGALGALGLAAMRAGDEVGTEVGEVIEDVASERSDETSTSGTEPPTSPPTSEPGALPENDGLALPLTYDTPASSLEELEARWAEGRAAVVAELSDPAYGIGDDNVLRGPDGFEVDLDDCPSGWTDPSPLDGGSIPIVATAPLTGPQDGFSAITTGMGAYFGYVNNTGGIDGAQLDLMVVDDEFNISKTVEAIGDLDYSNVLAVSTLGTANSLSVYDGLNADCIPHPFAITAHPGFGDPVDHPFSTGLMMAWGTEAVLWGSWIEEALSDQLPVKVGAIVADSEFGKAYASSFGAWAEANPTIVSEFIEVSHDPAAADLDADAQTLAANNPDVFISMTAGVACLKSVEGAINAGLMTDTVAQFHPSVCRDTATSVTPAGSGADGLMVLSGGMKSSTEAAFADDPFIAFVNDQLSAEGLDTTNGVYANGFGFYGWTYVEALRIAAELPGGLSRTNLLLAIRGMRLVHPMLLDGVEFGMWGNGDAFFVEGSSVDSYDAATGGWLSGAVIDRNRSTPTCNWNIRGC